jgi:hypothetical protein
MGHALVHDAGRYDGRPIRPTRKYTDLLRRGRQLDAAAAGTITAIACSQPLSGFWNCEFGELTGTNYSRRTNVVFFFAC